VVVTVRFAPFRALTVSASLFTVTEHVEERRHSMVSTGAADVTVQLALRMHTNLSTAEAAV
jgi:hypothetical protein